MFVLVCVVAFVLLVTGGRVARDSVTVKLSACGPSEALEGSLPTRLRQGYGGPPSESGRGWAREQ